MKKVVLDLIFSHWRVIHYNDKGILNVSEIEKRKEFDRRIMNKSFDEKFMYESINHARISISFLQDYDIEMCHILDNKIVELINA